jgi:4-hydroxy-3-methylbut-2-enyl diphosphate reductase
LEILKAKTAGFCFGVANAVRMSFDAVKSGKKVFTFGPIIHNDQVVNKLEKMGVSVIDSTEDLRRTSARKETVIIRAHGVGPSVYSVLENLGFDIIDATCPFVSKIHNYVRMKIAEGYDIIIAGNPEHPEVVGINGYCGNNAIIIEDVGDVNKVKDYSKLYCVVAQTTYNYNKWREITDLLKKLIDKCVIFDTICSATSSRQRETAEIAKQVQLMIVIGGRSSSNTLKLFDISKMYCSNVVWVETADELDTNYIKCFCKVGVTAGASTPDWIIEEVIGKMSDLDTVENEAFVTMLEDSLTTISGGQIVKGPIIRIDDKGVFINLRSKYEGYIPIEEFADTPDFDRSSLKLGDEVEAIVTKVNDKDGEAILSKRRIDYRRSIEKLEESYENKTPLKVKITAETKGGVVAYYGTVRIFIPASQLAERFVKDLAQFVGTSPDVMIISFEKGPKGKMRILGSLKAILAEEREKKESEFWSDMYVGKVCEGIVKGLTGFGAFVDIGGVDGLIHLTELSWARIKNAAEVLSVGQEVEVTVLSFDQEKRKISLGYRKVEDNPWNNAEEKYKIDDIIEVTVLRFVPFGVFVKIADGIDGLVHISQISNYRIAKASDVLKIGDRVMAKIVDVKIPERKINLSIKAVQPIDPIMPEKTEEEETQKPPKPVKKVEKHESQKKDGDPGENAKEYVEKSSNTIGDILASKELKEVMANEPEENLNDVSPEVSEVQPVEEIKEEPVEATEIPEEESPKGKEPEETNPRDTESVEGENIE